MTPPRLYPLVALLAAASGWALFAHGQGPAFIDKIADEILQRVRPADKPKLGELLSSGRLSEASVELNKLSLTEPASQSAARLRDLSIFLKHEDPGAGLTFGWMRLLPHSRTRSADHFMLSSDRPAACWG